MNSLRRIFARIFQFAPATLVMVLFAGQASAASDTWANPTTLSGTIDINNGAGVTSPDTQWFDTVTDPSFNTLHMVQNGDVLRFIGGTETSATENNRAYFVVDTPSPSTSFHFSEAPEGPPITVPSGEADVPIANKYHIWTDSTNWVGGSVPNGVDEVATFSDTPEQPLIMLDSSSTPTTVALGAIEFDGTGVRDLDFFGGAVGVGNTLHFETSSGTPAVNKTGNANFMSFGKTSNLGVGLNISSNQGLDLNLFAPELPTGANPGNPDENAPDGSTRARGMILGTDLSWDGFTGPLTVVEGNLDPAVPNVLPLERLVLGRPGSGLYARLGLFNGRHQVTGGLDGNATSYIANNGSTPGSNTLLTVGSNDQDGDFAGTLGRDNADDVAGVYRSNIELTKVGTGTQKISGTSFAAGPTNINGGTLLINGTHTARATTAGHLPVAGDTAMVADSYGQYAVNEGGVLGGTGTISPFDLDDATDPEGTAAFMVGVNEGGQIHPGNGGIGTLTFHGGGSDAALLNFAADAGSGGGTATFDLGSGASDQIAITGGQIADVTFNDTELNFNALSGAADGDYTLFTADVANAYAGLSVDGADVITGGLAIGAGLAPGSELKLLGNDIVVSAILADAEELPGDYNDDGVVNAADYTVWRDHLGQTYQLTNENPSDTNPGVVDQEDYAFWKSQFGQSLGSGSGLQAMRLVPEPASVLLAAIAAKVMGGLRRRRSCSFRPITQPSCNAPTFDTHGTT